MLTEHQKTFNCTQYYDDWSFDYKDYPELAKGTLNELKYALPYLLEEGEEWHDDTQIRTDEDMKEFISLWWFTMRLTLRDLLCSPNFWKNSTKEMREYIKKVVLTYNRFVYDPILRDIIEGGHWEDTSQDPPYIIREEYIKK
jgi:hypothetical protein